MVKGRSATPAGRSRLRRRQRLHQLLHGLPGHPHPPAPRPGRRTYATPRPSIGRPAAVRCSPPTRVGTIGVGADRRCGWGRRLPQSLGPRPKTAPGLLVGADLRVRPRAGAHTQVRPYGFTAGPLGPQLRRTQRRRCAARSPSAPPDAGWPFQGSVTKAAKGSLPFTALPDLRRGPTGGLRSRTACSWRPERAGGVGEPRGAGPCP